MNCPRCLLLIREIRTVCYLKLCRRTINRSDIVEITGYSMTLLDIDIRTVILVLSLGNLMAAVLFAAYRSCAQEKPDGFDALFLLGKIGQALAWFLIAMRGVVPVPFSLAVGNILLVGGQSAECFALASLTKVSRKFWAWIFGSLALFASVISLSLFRPGGYEVVPLLSLIRVVSALFFAVTGGGFLLLSPNPSWLTRLLGLFYSSYAFGIVCCFLSLADSGRDYSIFYSGVSQILQVILLSLVMFIGNIGYILVKKDEVDRQLFRMATRDSLTGAFNRAAFREESMRFWALGRRKEVPLSLLMIDMDYFKEVNDSYGHPAGDKVLRNVVAVIGSCLRPYDVLGRYGGEEFVVLLPEVDLEEARSVAERIRKAVEVGCSGRGQDLGCTVSVGVASCNPGIGTVTYDDLLQCSDDALYEAKRRGRNSVVVFSEESGAEPPLQNAGKEPVTSELVDR